MKDFDKARQARIAKDRDFLLGGERFRMMSGVKPEAIAAYDALPEDASLIEQLQAIDGMILALIENSDGGHSRYREIRDRDTDPITMEDLKDVLDWLIEEQNRPPYVAALRLYSLARGRWNDLDGRLLLSGHAGGIDSLTLRQLLNVTYTLIASNMDKDELKEFDRQLSWMPTDKAPTARPRSRGIGRMMLAMGGSLPPGIKMED